VTVTVRRMFTGDRGRAFLAVIMSHVLSPIPRVVVSACRCDPGPILLGRIHDARALPASGACCARALPVGHAWHDSRRRWRRCRSGRPSALSGPARSVVGVSGAVAGDERIEDLADRGSFGVVEKGGGFEGEAERLVVGEAGGVAEDEGVGGA
jgi:hypothetical protein